MNIETVIYLADIISSFGSAFIIILVTSLIIAAICGVACCGIYSDTNEKENFYNKVKKNYLIFIKVWIFLLFLSCFFPSEKTIYLMLGANYLKTSTLPSKVEMAIEKKIDSYLAAEKVIKK